MRPDSRGRAAGLLLVLVALTLLFACARDPHGGHAFGARRHAGCTAALAVGLAFLSSHLAKLPRGRLWLRVCDALVLGLVLYNLGLTELAVAGKVKLAPL